MGLLERIAEEKIAAAIRRGELDNLPGAGKPLELNEHQLVPADLRMGYKILKNANCLPPELETRKQIRQLCELLPATPDNKERRRIVSRVNYLITKLSMNGRAMGGLQVEDAYYYKLVEQLTKHGTG